MKPEAQRIAIAEACGFSHDIREGTHIWHKDGWMASSWVGFGALPDYLGDLDAMHEAEKVLTGEHQWRNYIAHLIGLRWDEAWSFTDATLAVHATAAQRAEAFLKTLGLWRDGVGKPSLLAMEHGTPRQFPKSGSLSSPAPTGSSRE